MAVEVRRHQFGSGQGKIVLLTARDGLAAQVGHDLTIEVSRWSAELEVADDLSAADLFVRADLNSLVVRAGTGGVMPLTDRDRREIAVTARKVMRVDRHPEATFSAQGLKPDQDGDGAITGTLTIAGVSRPLTLDVTRTGQDSYHATASVRQSDFGLKPYTAFLGALKVSDAVRIAVDVELPPGVLGNGAGGQAGDGAGGRAGGRADDGAGGQP
ncbi:MAG TPA: YceI family protein [Streptosporangiaceae bacterium]|nr:YceI family protein [Streptosporangiaceae bacterium]